MTNTNFLPTAKPDSSDRHFYLLYPHSYFVYMFCLFNTLVQLTFSSSVSSFWYQQYLSIYLSIYLSWACGWDRSFYTKVLHEKIFRKNLFKNNKGKNSNTFFKYFLRYFFPKYSIQNIIVYEWISIENIIEISKIDLVYIKLVTLVEGNLKAPFSIATTLRCRGGCYSIPWIAPLYPRSLPYNAEC